ncbi:MAG: hypothetical protein U0570_09600 [Phycisphaerales bacterium]
MKAVWGIVGAMALGSSSFAAIVGTTGAAVLVAPPPSLASGVYVHSTQVRVMNEKTNVLFTGVVDRLFPPIGVPQTLFTVAPALIGPVRVNSHLIHFDNKNVPQAGPVTGTVTFDKAIIGVIYTNTRLDASDAALGNLGTVYPFGHLNRGFSGVIDTFTLLSPFTLRFTLANGGEMDQIRVLTVPAPATGVCGGALLVAARRRRR